MVGAGSDRGRPEDRHTHAQLVDLFPTLGELTGEEPPSRVSGFSFAATLTQSEPDTRRPAIFTSAAYGGLASDVLPPDLAPSDKEGTPRHTRVMHPMHRTKMVRTHEWKFILNETEPPEFYQLADGSPRERLNLVDSNEYSGVRRRLERRLQDWRRW